jgi:hypothetical protein
MFSSFFIVEKGNLKTLGTLQTSLRRTATQNTQKHATKQLIRESRPTFAQHSSPQPAGAAEAAVIKKKGVLGAGGGVLLHRHEETALHKPPPQIQSTISITTAAAATCPVATKSSVARVINHHPRQHCSIIYIYIYISPSLLVPCHHLPTKVSLHSLLPPLNVRVPVIWSVPFNNHF